MRKWNKFFAILCALMLVLGSMSLGSFAEEGPTEQEIAQQEEAARIAAEEEAARIAAEEEAARKAAEEEAARKAAEEEAARKAAEEEAARKAAEEEAARKAAEEEAARKAAEEEAARKAAEEEAARKAAEEEAARKAAEEEAARKSAEEEAAKQAEEAAAEQPAEEATAEPAAEEIPAEQPAEEATAEPTEEAVPEQPAEEATAEPVEEAASEQPAEEEPIAEEASPFELDGDKLIAYHGEDAVVTVPDGVRVIGKDAFSDNTEIVKVVLPDSVEEIERGAFKDCRKLREIVIGRNSGLTVIGSEAFAGCEALDPSFANRAEQVAADAFDTPRKPAEVKEEKAEVVLKETRAAAAPTIEEQPMSVTDSVVGQSVKIQVKAAGTNLTYAWYYKRTTDSDFRKWNNQTSSTLSFTMRVDWDGIQIYGMVTDGNGLSATTETVTVNVGEPEITVQPKDVEDGAAGASSTISLTAKGSGLTYAWYYKFATDGASWTKWNNQTSNKLTFTARAAWENMSVKCVVTDQLGRTVESDVVTVKFTKPEITVQPVSITDSTVGNTVNVSLTATGADLTYAWYYKRSIDTDFRKWNNQTKDTLTFTMREDWDGIQIYGLVTDKNGTTAQSDTITVTIYSAAPEITVQPKDVEDGAAGVQSTISLTAIGRGLTYEWYYKFATAGASWTKWNNQTSNTLTFTARAAWENMSVKCVVTDKQGRTVESDVVTVKFTKPEITVQPVSIADSTVGNPVSVSLTATGADLTYAWYYKRPIDTDFRKWSNQTKDTLTFTMREDWDGIQIYGLVTDKNGTTAQSDTIKVEIYSADPEITVQPKDIEDGAIGVQSTISLTAIGRGLTYEWYYKFAAAGSSWTKWNNQTSNTLTFAPKAAWENMSVKCVVTDKKGRTVESDVVTVKFMRPEITVQPVSIHDSAEGNTVTVSLTATGANLTYAWYYKRPIDTDFRKWNNQTKDTLTFTMREDWDGILIYSVVTDKNGMTATSDTVTVEIYDAAPEITVQPQDVEDGAIGVQTTISLTAIGRGLTYEWQYKFAAEGSEWTVWKNQTTNTLTFAPRANWENMSVKCIVTDRKGRTVESDVVTVKFEWPEITEQPTYVMDGITVTASLKATGKELTYAWYYKLPGEGTEWKQWNNKTEASLTFDIRAAWEDIQVYAVAKDVNGMETKSEVLTISYTEFTMDDVQYVILEKGADVSIGHYLGTAASVVIPAQPVGYTVKEVGEEAFMGNTALTSIDLPDTITVIRARAFKDCTSLKEMK